MRDFFLNTLQIKETFEVPQLIAALVELSQRHSTDFNLVLGVSLYFITFYLFVV